MKKIIVFGATGNLGSYCIDYLLENLDLKKYEVIATGRRSQKDSGITKIPYVQVDITNKADFEKLPQKDVYAVIDFAGALPAYVNYTDEDYIKININGTLNICEYCRKSGADRIVFTQTWADLNGYLKEGKPLKADLPRKPILTGDHAVYCITKCAAVDLLAHYRAEYGIRDFVFRLPNIYLYAPTKYYYVNGEQKKIGYRYMIDRAIKGEPIECWGDPKAGKDIVYVKDLCGMIFAALFVDRESGIYNVGTGVKTSMEDQIKGFIKVFSPKGHPSEIVYRPEKPSCDQFVMDISNIKSELGYTPKYDYISYLKDYKKEMEKDQKEGK
ncbi:NAD(P)-dependent oxidoreductase [Candidatus Saccharibacteria bacterium]|nr:NAD(P)-dependent oxidoreductase [Candidatus Saccharibacteria bacterium]